MWEGRSREAPPYPDLWHTRTVLIDLAYSPLSEELRTYRLPVESAKSTRMTTSISYSNRRIMGVIFSLTLI